MLTSDERNGARHLADFRDAGHGICVDVAVLRIPSTRFERDVAFTAAVLIGSLVATMLNSKDGIRLLGRVLSAVIVLSVVWVYLFPRYGVHNAGDNGETPLVGNWRGVFSHRTGLGHVAGLTTVLLVFYGSQIWSSRIFRYGIVVLSVLCLIKADSGGGLLTLTFGAFALLFSQALIQNETRCSRLGLFPDAPRRPSSDPVAPHCLRRCLKFS